MKAFSLSELTAIIFDMDLIHFGLEVSKYIKTIIFQVPDPRIESGTLNLSAQYSTTRPSRAKKKKFSFFHMPRELNSPARLMARY